jgi:hypothetical protein
MEGCFLDTKNQVGGLKRPVHFRTRLRDVGTRCLILNRKQTVDSTHTNILPQWTDPTFTLLYKHAYIIPADQLCDGIWCEGSPAFPYTLCVFATDPNGNWGGLR